METILFESEKFKSMYSCPQLNDTEWQKLKNPNVVVGSFYMIMGSVYTVAYIPFLIVMLKKDFIRHSCYKLMFFLGLIDILATIDGGIFVGYFQFQGDVWCTNKTFFFYTISAFTGSMTIFYSISFLACWVGACATGLLLLINRILDLFNAEFANMFFSGKKTYLWLMFPSGVMFYIWFLCQPFFPNSYLGALFFDPYAGILNNTYFNPQVYHADWLPIVNVGVVVVFPILYAILCLVLFIKTKMAESASVSKLQKQTVFQSLIICLFIIVASLIYAYMQYFPTPPLVIVMGHVCWQASHGGAVLAYIFINRSMRNAVIRLVRNPFGRWDRSTVGPTSEHRTTNKIHSQSFAPSNQGGTTEHEIEFVA